MKKNVAIIGLDEGDESYLESHLHDGQDVLFKKALSRAETKIEDDDFQFAERLDRALRRMDGDGGCDGIFTYWDFPASLLTSFAAAERNLAYASVESVMKCEHKLWTRLEQAKVIHAPDFSAFDPFDQDPLSSISVPYPFWVKPVVGHSSMLGFEITNDDDFEEALAQIRDQINEMTKPFAYAFEHADMPSDLRQKGPHLCLAEEIISDGEQFTLEGYSFGGDIVIYGVIESVRRENGHSFSHFLYPARLPDDAEGAMEEMARKVIRQIGFDGSTFNIEFFYNADTGRIDLLEVNSRLSQSHSEIFYKVDGQAQQQIAVDLALGREPHWRHRAGDFAVAAKFFMRHFEDAKVVAVPNDDAIAQVHREMPDVRVAINPKTGEWLSDMLEQESYSFEIADLFIGANDEEELLRKRDRCEEILKFQFEPAPEQH